MKDENPTKLILEARYVKPRIKKIKIGNECKGLWIKGYWYIHLTHRNGEPFNHKYNSKRLCKEAIDRLVALVGVEKCKIRGDYYGH